MPLKIKVNAEEFEKLPEYLQSEYTKAGDAYQLNLEDMEDTGALKRAKDHEKEQRKAAEQRARELEQLANQMKTQLDELQNGDFRKKGDVEALEKSYQKKLQDLEARASAERERLASILHKNTLEATARKLATDLAGERAEILLPHIKSRLQVEMGDNDINIRVLDPTGKVSADSIDDLKNSFFTNDVFAPIVIGSKASGSGAAGQRGGGGATKRISEMSATEEAQFAKSNPEAYERQLKAEGLT